MADAVIDLRDTEILWVPPANENDERVPSAEELAGNSHLAQRNLKEAHRMERPAGVRNRPEFTAGGGKTVVIPGDLQIHAPGHPAVQTIPTATLTLPNLPDTTSTVSRYDYLYLAVMQFEFNATHDPAILQTFQYTQGGSTQVLTQENTRRLRSVYAFAWAATPITAADLVAALPANRQITINKAATGMVLGAYRFYPLDSAIASGATHTIKDDSIELIDLCRVWRSQNFNQAGHIWGRGGEGAFTAEFHLQPIYRYVGPGWDDLDARAKQTLRRILLGQSLPNSAGRDLATYNLINGQVGTNQDSPGIATPSPNGSTAIANSQRVSFSNQAITQTQYCLAVATVSAGGFAQGAVPFQGNSPNGAAFSQDKTKHRVYNSNGTDITDSGVLTGLGGNGSLIWTANTAHVVAPGDQIYIQPAIDYPAGSGFPNAGTVDAIFVFDGALRQINSANIREGINDLTAYTAPSGGQELIVIMGRERGAVHYVYERFSVNSDANGVVRIPANSNGAIAFMSGTNAPAGRIDKPVVSGLNASTTYQILCYRPFKAGESWQFRFNVPRYAGSGERSLIDGGMVSSTPIFLGHTQGGGNSEFLAEAGLQYEVLSFRLPENSNASAVPAYRANYRMQFKGAPDLGETSVRLIEPQGATGLALASPGLRIAAPAATGPQTKGIACQLQVFGSTVRLGFRKLPIVCDQIYQMVSAFIISKDGADRLCVITQNGGDPARPSAIAYDSDGPDLAAIDTFRLY
jgi:hypothetical protein